MRFRIPQSGSFIGVRMRLQNQLLYLVSSL